MKKETTLVILSVLIAISLSVSECKSLESIHSLHNKFDLPSNFTFIPATDPHLVYSGRMNFSTETQSYGFDWSGIIISFAVKNISKIQVAIIDNNSQYNIFVNGFLISVITTIGESQLYYPVNYELQLETPYFIQITRKTEAQNNPYAADFFGVLISENGVLLQSNPKPSRKIEFLGDSITCGYGNLGPSTYCYQNPGIQLEDNWETYGAMIARQFDAEYHIECWSGIGVVRNYGSPNITSSDTFPVYFNRTIAQSTLPTYPFDEFKPDAVICNLGTNDYSTEPTPPQPVFEQGYRGLVKQIREAYGESVPLFLVCGPMITGECCTYVQNVVDMEPNTYYINLQNILETQEIGCDGHPNVQGHQKMAYLSLPIIQNVLGW